MFKKNATLRVLFSVSILLTLYSCHDNLKDGGAMNDSETHGQDSVNAPNDKSKSLPDLSKNVPMVQKNVDKDFEQNKIKIEKKFGDQWDFCRCTLANDSLDKVVKSGVEIDDEFLARFEEVDQKCKAFLVMNPNKTPEDRALHEKKIKECLKLNR